MSKLEPKKQLELLKQKCQVLAPGIYNDQAIYLKIIRSIIVNSVIQALFIIISDQKQEIFQLLTNEKKKSLQNKIESLVNTSTSNI